MFVNIGKIFGTLSECIESEASMPSLMCVTDYNKTSVPQPALPFLRNYHTVT